MAKHDKQRQHVYLSAPAFHALAALKVESDAGFNLSIFVSRALVKEAKRQGIKIANPEKHPG